MNWHVFFLILLGFPAAALLVEFLYPRMISMLLWLAGERSARFRAQAEVIFCVVLAVALAAGLGRYFA